MSTSTDAILAYGYDLGDSPAFTGIADADFPDWWDGEEDFERAVIHRLLEADPPAKYAGLGVGIETHCSASAPMYLLVASSTVTVASRGTAETVEPLDVSGWAKDRLAWAVDTLGLDLAGQEPRWLLASYWNQ